MIGPEIVKYCVSQSQVEVKKTSHCLDRLQPKHGCGKLSEMWKWGTWIPNVSSKISCQMPYVMLFVLFYVMPDVISDVMLNIMTDVILDALLTCNVGCLIRCWCRYHVICHVGNHVNYNFGWYHFRFYVGCHVSCNMRQILLKLGHFGECRLMVSVENLYFSFEGPSKSQINWFSW